MQAYAHTSVLDTITPAILPNTEIRIRATVVRPRSASKIRVRSFRPSDARAWDEFVERHPHGSPFHLLAWKRSIEQTFGYRAIYLVAYEGHRLRGVLPLFYIRNPLAGRVLLSTPFAVYGGPLMEGHGVAEVFAETLRRLGEQLRVDHIELRNNHEDQCLGFSRVPRYVSFTQEIGPNEQAILESIPRKTRRMVRKSLENGLITRRRSDLSSDFERLYQENIRRLGTPAFPRRHFTNLLANFRGNIDIREVVHEGKVIAGVMSLYFRDQALPYYGASDLTANSLAPNNYMYFDQMREAGREGYRLFDFGRSKKAVGGSYDFKAHWGMVERELPYEMLLIRRKELPNLTPANPIFDLPRKMWQRLPMALVRAIGPNLVRLVP